VSIDFHRLIEAIDNNRLIVIDYIDYIDCLLIIDFYRLATPGTVSPTDAWSTLNRQETLHPIQDLAARLL